MTNKQVKKINKQNKRLYLEKNIKMGLISEAKASTIDRNPERYNL